MYEMLKIHFISIGAISLSGVFNVCFLWKITIFPLLRFPILAVELTLRIELFLMNQCAAHIGSSNGSDFRHLLHKWLHSHSSNSK